MATTGHAGSTTSERGRCGAFVLAVAATALIALVALAAPSPAMPTGPGVREGRNVSVFHNLDFVAAYGYGPGERLTIDVYRGPHRIATASGAAASTPEGPGLEVNHGPEGTAQQGDCWENFTPDILPGDRVVVTDSSGATDEVLVDDISFSGGPREDLSTQDPTDVIIEGRAAYADATPISVERLDSGEVRHENPRFRATPNVVERIPGTADGWRAIYRYPYNVVQVRESLTVEERKAAILNGDHAMGYGHTEPLPGETQLVEGLGSGGPALGCEGSPRRSNAITTSDDSVINLKSGDLELGGTAEEGVSAVSVVLSDEDPATADVIAEAQGLTAGPGEKAFSAGVSRAQLESLADGILTASGEYTLAEGGSETGGGRTIVKDTLAPQPPTARPPAGTYDTRREISLAGEPGASIYYTTGGREPTRRSTLYTAPFVVSSSQTVRAITVDRAGNESAGSASFEYVIRHPSAMVLRTSTANLRLGMRRAIRGEVRPAHGGTVRLTIRRNGRTVLARNLALENSRYSFEHRPAAPGRYSATVRFAGDADHRPSAATKTYRVLRR